jgi:hypothetical protein
MLASKSSHYFFLHVDARWKNCIQRVTLLFLQSPKTRREHDLLQRITHCRIIRDYTVNICMSTKSKNRSFFVFHSYDDPAIRCVYIGWFKLSAIVDVLFFLFLFFYNGQQLAIARVFFQSKRVGHELLLITLKLIFPSVRACSHRGNGIRMLDYLYF